MSDKRPIGGDTAAEPTREPVDDLRLQVGPDNSCALIFLREGRALTNIFLTAEQADVLQDILARRKESWEKARAAFQKGRH